MEKMNIETTFLTESKPLDRDAIVDLYDRHSSGIFRYAYRLLGNQDMAEECVAEIFSRFLHAVRAGKGPSENIQAYLYRMAHNWVTDQYRRQPQPTLELDLEEHADHSSNPSTLVHQNLERDRVRKALQQLPYEQQRVIELRFLDDLPHEDVARSLGKSIEATRALQYRALTALRQMLIEK
jgi:RNA polymerase sigma-70 factor, ECF subfamily